MKTVVDFLGRPISVGDEVAYAASAGRSSILVHARVVEVRPENYIAPGERDYNRKASFVVEPIKRLFKSYSKNPAKKIALLFPERCVVVKAVN